MPSPDSTTHANGTAAASPSSPSTSTSHKSSNHAADLAAIDQSITRMRALTPQDPYVLTIPQDDELRYHYTWRFQARQWLEHTPFDASEHESIQYQTFVFHDPATDIFLQHSLRPKEEPNGLVGNMASGAGTPASSAPKKKITLDMYKKKQAGEVTGSGDELVVKEKDKHEVGGLKKPAVKSPAETAKVDLEVLAAVEEVEAEDSSRLKTDKAASELKRKREAEPIAKGVGATSSKVDFESQDSDEAKQPALKKTKTSPSRPQKESAAATTTTAERRDSPAERSGERSSQQLSHEIGHKKASKALHATTNSESQDPSTSMPPRLSPLHVSALPSRLSPTIPENIAATLKARASFRSSSASSSSARENHKLTPPKRLDGVTKHKSPVPRNGFRASSGSPAVLSDSDDRGRRRTSASKVRSATPDRARDDEIAVSKRAKSSPSRRRLLVILKISEVKHRDRLKKILRPSKDPVRHVVNSRDSASETDSAPAKSSDQRHRERRELASKGVAQKIGPGSDVSKHKAPQPTTAVSDKRSRPADSCDTEAPPKRSKLPPDAHNQEKVQKKAPSTPNAPSVLSPPAPSSGQKHVTPSMRKDALSSAMRREQSNNSTLTPTGRSSPPITGGATIVPASDKTSTAKPASNQPSNQTPLQHAWEAEQKRLETLGRELKHAATAHRTSADDTTRDARQRAHSQRLAALTSLSSLIAYILAFTAADEACRAADPPLAAPLKLWRSLQAYHGFVRHQCDAFPPLLGLVYALGIVFSQRILDLAGRSNLPLETVLDLVGAVKRNADEADRRLDIDSLAEHFPTAWKGRTAKPSSSSASASAAEKKLHPGSWRGDYALPFGVHTAPVSAARAAGAILREWVDRHNASADAEKGEAVVYEERLRV